MVRTADTAACAALQYAEFVFDGSFNGKPVRWRCHLETLACAASKSRRRLLRQFIEISPQLTTDTGEVLELPVHVGLNVPEIDASVIEKTRIMIRNYKRLKVGRHEYGDTFEFEVD